MGATSEVEAKGSTVIAIVKIDFNSLETVEDRGIGRDHDGVFTHVGL